MLGPLTLDLPRSPTCWVSVRVCCKRQTCTTYIEIATTKTFSINTLLTDCDHILDLSSIGEEKKAEVFNDCFREHSLQWLNVKSE